MKKKGAFSLYQTKNRGVYLDHVTVEPLPRFVLMLGHCPMKTLSRT